MRYEAKNYEHLLGIPGFSNPLLRNHFKLYQGYVKNTNLFMERMRESLQQGKENTPEFCELRRRFGWEFNGMRLHELYFGNMKKDGGPLAETAELRKKMIEDFGSAEAWEQDFKATAAMRGIGWVIFCHEPAGDRLFNVWVDEHDEGYLTGASILLVFDVFEHAFTLDYGLKKAEYTEAFLKIVDWAEVEERFETPVFRKSPAGSIRS